MAENSSYKLVSLGQFGDRARPLRQELREAVLVIGLGHVGLHAVAHIHDMLDVMLSRRDLQYNVRLLAIARRRSILEEAALPREERLPLDLDPIDWSDVPGRYAPLGVAQWWPHSPRSREMLEDPNRVRAYNRLMLYHNAALVSEALYKLAQWLLSVGTGRDLNLHRRIYVVSSLAEAEGSAMIFDIVSRLRALVRAKPTTIMGVFSLRARDAGRDTVLDMANAYATLREIDSYTLHPETFVSLLPAIGHSLDRTHPPRALDTIFLTDDAASTSSELPENALADCVTTWIAARLAAPDQTRTLPEPITVEHGTDRFYGYSTFGMSKLALPTRAAMDLSAVGLAQAVLRAAKTAHSTSPTTSWAAQIVSTARKAVFETDVLNDAEVSDRMREWTYDLSVPNLTRKLEARASRGESSQMADLLQTEWQRLQREAVSETDHDQNMVATLPDSLRNRITNALASRLRDVYELLISSPVELAYGRGYGLVWAIGAFEELSQQVRAALPGVQHMLKEAQAAHEMSVKALFEAAQQYDSRSGGRFGSSRRTAAAELDTCTADILQSTAELIAVQAQVAVWHDLHQLAEDLRDQVRETIPKADRELDDLNAFEIACRTAMEEAVSQPPQFPVGVALTEQWYTDGIQNLTSYGQLPPRDLLKQVYNAWSPPSDLLPERLLGRFLTDTVDAARRMLSGVYQFADLVDFLGQHRDYREALGVLPNSATPVMIPTIDDKHPKPRAYEIVREHDRFNQLLGAGQQGVARTFVPSPDPDEIAVMRILHGTMAESLPALRESYRRAYDRAGAEGAALHIDRRWDSTMADLVHTSARREISIIWEDILTALHKGPRHAEQPLEKLVRALGTALEVTETLNAAKMSPDLRLVLYKLRPFMLKLPPPTCAVIFMCSNRPADEVGQEIYQAIRPLPLEEHFAFVVNVTQRPDMDQVVERLHAANYTTLVLDEADIKHLISARVPTRALGDLVLSRVDLTTVSPFFTRGPVPDRMFFGRNREITEALSKLREHSVALIGGRRIGKTSTLQRIDRQLKPVQSDYIPYYLDLYGVKDYHDFFFLVNRRWNVDEIDETARPVKFEDVILVLQQRHPDKKVVILLDEVDALLEYDRSEHKETLFRMFRSLSNEKRSQFIFGGEKGLLRAMINPYSALFNFVETIRLEPLPPKVVQNLVAEPFETLNIWIEQPEDVIERIYEISAGHPNIVQMICQGLVEELDHNSQNANLLNFDHLDKATRRRTLQEQIVQTIWGQMSPLARMVTLLWPENERFLTINELEELLADVGIHEIPPNRLERTATDLELYCFVRRRDHDSLELIPMAFPAILDFMTDKKRQIQIVRQQYEIDPEGVHIDDML